MKISQKMSAVHRLLRAERFPWMCFVACSVFTSKLRSGIVGSLIHARGIYLGPRCVLRGTAFMDFGRDIYVHGHLWLEAVASYREQTFAPKIVIGDRVAFSDGVHITCIEKILIGKDVLFGSHVYVSDHNHGSYKGRTQSHPDEPPSRRALGGGGPVVIEENAWIGDNTIIVGPVIVGRGSIVAANAVVRTDVPPLTMVGGIPAKPLRRFDPDEKRWVKIEDLRQSSSSRPGNDHAHGD